MKREKDNEEGQFVRKDTEFTRSVKNSANIYQPIPPLGIPLFEKTWRVKDLFGVPTHIHITLPFYIACELLWAVLHYKESGYFLLHSLVVLVVVLFSILLNVVLTMWSIDLSEATLHRCIIWPFGIMGYGYDFKNWYHLLGSLFAGTFINLVIALVFICLSLIAGHFQREIKYPMSENWGVNVINSCWIINLDLFVFQYVVPVYSTKAARLLSSILTYKREHPEVARILIYPSGFMGLITLAYVATEDARVQILVMSLWCFYQTFLLWQAIRKNCVRMLPLFQLLQGGLRAEAHRRRHSSQIHDMTKTLGPSVGAKDEKKLKESMLAQIPESKEQAQSASLQPLQPSPSPQLQQQEQEQKHEPEKHEHEHEHEQKSQEKEKEKEKEKNTESNQIQLSAAVELAQLTSEKDASNNNNDNEVIITEKKD